MSIATGQVALAADVNAIAMQTQSSPVRVKGTIYQNTTGKIMFVTVTINVASAASGAIYSDSATPPTVPMASFSNSNAQPGYQSASFHVLNNNYYKLTELGGTITILQWVEDY